MRDLCHLLVQRCAGCAKIWPAVFGVVLIFAFLDASAAQPAHPDLSGAWAKRDRTAEGEHMPPPFTPEGMRLYERNLAAIDAQDSEIAIALRCLPSGYPRSLFGRNPFYILQTPGAIGIITESSPAQMIYLDVPHRELWPMYMGDSIGHWEGDTLIVDVVNLTDKTFLTSAASDFGGMPHSDALHVVARYTLLDDGQTLRTHATIEDPKIFTEPWNIIIYYTKQDADNRPIENVCENPRLRP